MDSPDRRHSRWLACLLLVAACGDGDPASTGSGSEESSSSSSSSSSTTTGDDDAVDVSSGEPVPQPGTCGDGMVNEGVEVCDGDAGTETCVSRGFVGGVLGCGDDCDFDDSGCSDSVRFTTCGQAGASGPTQAQCDIAYADTSLAGVVEVVDGYQSWIVPTDGTYAIEAWGARGGSDNDGVVIGGARIRGELVLQAGDRITIVVGQAGSDVTFPSSPRGGGGGTFVVLDEDTPLVVAGGGGSNGGCGGIDYEEMYGQASTGHGYGGVGAADLVTRCDCGDGSPGGGFLTDGSPSGGDGFTNGARGDDTPRRGECAEYFSIGGFGGGGNSSRGGAGGGGYGGGNGDGADSNGFGGSSYNAGTAAEGESGVGVADGEVRISLLAS